MSKILIIILTFLLWMQPASSNGVTGVYVAENPLKDTTVVKMADAVFDFLFLVSIALASVLYIIAGLMFITSTGIPQRIESAKKLIFYTTAGLVFFLLAKGLVYVVKSIVGAQ